MSDRRNTDSVFQAALELDSEASRTAFVREACGNDDELRSRVDRLLAAHLQAGSFMSITEAVAQSENVNSTLQIGTHIGPYKLLEQIGEGGMGVVYVAEQTAPVRRRVALKVIKPGMDTRQVVARFEAERQALALMDHPNIARILDGGWTGDRGEGVGGSKAGSSLSPTPCPLSPSSRPYFVMELVRGMPITDYCDRAGLSPRDRLVLFAQVCRAVQHAHMKGVIHRDLKPANVMVTLHDGTPVPKVIDFGVAKAIGQPLTDRSMYTRFAQMVGTPLYMAPEQAELSGLDVDRRADVYSLGVLLYELLTGTTPFDPEALRKAGLDEVRRMIREDEPPRPSQRLSTLTAEARSTASGRRGLDDRRLVRLLRGDLDWVAMKALEKDRNRRYESAGALAADVERYLTDEPVEARPPTAWYRLGKFARRNRAALITLTAVAVALVLGTGVSAWQAVEADRARALADARLEDEKQARADAETQRQRAQASFEKALEAVKKMLTEVGDVKVAAIPQMQAVRARLLEDALAFYTDLIALDPGNPRTYYERGKVGRLVGQYSKYNVDFLKAAELEPDNGEYAYEWAFCWAGAANEYEFVRYATRAVELKPTIESRMLLGDA